MRRVFWGIAHNHNPNRYSLNLTARNGRNGKTIAITSARYAVKIVVHERWHTLKQLNPWRV
jgi:ABC-type transport system involved in Fe-S cluster assembly fused permease/ATPase subunit